MSSTRARLSASQKAALDALGIVRWVPRNGEISMVPAGPLPSGVAPSSGVPAPAAAMPPPPVPADPGAWEALQAEVRGCTRCRLHATRTQTVFGVGNTGADWMVVGEAPGADEDRQGEPFVGRAGQLLNEMLLAIGLTRDAVYIANVLKCRPPENRDPKPDESSSCEGYLQRQIMLVQPRILLAVGRIAAQNLLKTETPIGRLRGQVHHYGPLQTPLVVTYHPAYLLRSPGQKRKAWEDLLLARRTARRE